MGKQVIKQQTVNDSFLVFVFSLGIMVSPDTLAMVGNFFGRTGNIGFFLIIFSAIIYFTLASQYKQLFIFSSEYASDIEILNTALGIMPSLFPFFVKSIVVIFMSTGLLVSSGFVFNEVFLYWFPNFGFAFILLGLLLGLQFLPGKLASNLQIIFCAIPISGLVILIIAGIIQADQFIDFKPGDVDYSISSLELEIYFLPLLFFIGFDLGFSIHDKSDKKFLNNYNVFFMAVIFMGILFILWGYVLLLHVPVEKLTDTRIPHIIAAKSILGDSGRFIMGAIVISGSLSAIHALFTIVSKQGSMLFKTNRLSENTATSKIIILCLSLIIAGMMAGGMAGEENLEIFIQASLILWLILYAMISISHIVILSKPAQKYHTALLFQKIKNVLCLLILGISILILTGMNDKPILILKFLSVIFFISLILGTLFMLRYNKKN